SCGHAHARDAVLELLDDVLLVAALVGEVDGFLGGGRGREVRQHVAVAPELEELALLMLFDPLAADHQAIGRLAGMGTVGDLGNPLAPEAQDALASLTGEATTQIRPPLAALRGRMRTVRPLRGPAIGLPG